MVVIHFLEVFYNMKNSFTRTKGPYEALSSFSFCRQSQLAVNISIFLSQITAHIDIKLGRNVTRVVFNILYDIQIF